LLAAPPCTTGEATGAAAPDNFISFAPIFQLPIQKSNVEPEGSTPADGLVLIADGRREWLPPATEGLPR
jgi:hypothetical protein